MNGNFNYNSDVWIGGYICTVTTRNNGGEFLTDVMLRYANTNKVLAEFYFKSHANNAIQAATRHERVVKHLEEKVGLIKTMQQQLKDVFDGFVLEEDEL